MAEQPQKKHLKIKIIFKKSLFLWCLCFQTVEKIQDLFWTAGWSFWQTCAPSLTRTYSLKIYIIEISSRTILSLKGRWSKENVLAVQSACCSLTSNIDICLGASDCLGCPQTNLNESSLPRNKTCLSRKYHNHYHSLVHFWSHFIF